MTDKKDDNPVKIEFLPGCFDNFEGTQEELDEFIAELEAMVADGSFIEKSQPLDFDALFEEDPVTAMTIAIQTGQLDGLINEAGQITDPFLDEELSDKDREILVDMFRQFGKLDTTRKLN